MKKLVLSTLLAASLGSVAFAQQTSPALRALLQTLEKSDAPTQLNVLRGINAAMKGKRNVAAPEGWPAIYEKLRQSPDEEVRRQAQALAVVFGGGGALEELRKALADANAPLPARRAALDSLVSARDATALPALLALVKEAGPLRAPALRGLASFDDARIPETILAAYGTLTSEEKGNALGTLLTRPAWGHAVIGAIDAKTVARADLSAPLARQLADFKDAKISDWLAKNWGAVRPTSAEKQQQIAGYKKLLTIDALNKADPSHGRAIYGQVCAACHTLFGAGGKVGPELPGAYEDVDYLLQNIIDPNAVIGKDYQQTIVRTKDGQQLMGIVAGEDATTLTLKTLAGMLTVQRADIAGVEVMEVSLMPEGLLTALNETQVRDLFAYLRRHGQVPMLLSPNNANDFFNGTDLARWIPSKADAWRVENGEIVGKGNAQRAEFLTSDTVAGDFKLTALVQLSGADAAGEIVLRGQFTDGGLEGVGLGLGKAPAGLLLHRPPKAPVPVAEAKPLAAEKWTKLEITATGSKVRVTADGAPAAQCDVPEGSSRTVPAFYVSGPGSELRIKDLRIEMLAK